MKLSFVPDLISLTVITWKIGIYEKATDLLHKYVSLFLTNYNHYLKKYIYMLSPRVIWYISIYN